MAKAVSAQNYVNADASQVHCGSFPSAVLFACKMLLNRDDSALRARFTWLSQACAGEPTSSSLLPSALLHGSCLLLTGAWMKPGAFQGSRAELLVLCVSLDCSAQEAVKDGDEF